MAHLHPNPFKKKMSVKLAVQVLCNNVASAIRTCISTGELKYKTALNTAHFVDDMNNCFDSLNSKNIFDMNHNRRPIPIIIILYKI